MRKHIFTTLSHNHFLCWRMNLSKGSFLVYYAPGWSGVACLELRMAELLAAEGTGDEGN